MKTFAAIFLCMFAVYGAYMLIIGICAFLSGKARVVYSVRAASPELERDISSAAYMACRTGALECEPVVLCENDEDAERVRECGLDVYIRDKGQ